MKAVSLYSLVTGILLLAAVLPAGADDSGAVAAKLGAASSAVQSFVATMHMNGTTGVDATITFVRPQRMKSELMMGKLNVETYVVDGTVYVHVANGNWQKLKVDPSAPQTLSIADSLKTAKVTALPDRRDGAITVGVIQIVTQLPAIAGPIAQAATQPLTCTYDKASYRMRACANTVMTMTYAKYDDPANSVVLPQAALSAVQMVVPAALGQTSPAPVATAVPAVSPLPASSPQPVEASPSAPLPTASAASPSPGPTP